MSIEQTNIVDFINIEPVSENVVLTLADPLPWTTNDHDHLLMLQEKLNVYLSFVESGEILETYPEARDRRITISMVFKYEPNAAAHDFIEKAQAAIEAAGMELRFETF
jgi:Family of unknown function (DUF6572)